jgi:hypothetical protein
MPVELAKLEDAWRSSPIAAIDYRGGRYTTGVTQSSSKDQASTVTSGSPETDFLHIESGLTAQQAASDCVVEILIRQPLHGFFRRASKRSRRPLADHSSS